MSSIINYFRVIAEELSVRPQQVESVASLLDGDNTVPFIARYRKEATGSLDEVAVAAIRDRLEALRELDKRRAAILSSLEERELLTDALRAQVVQAATLTVLEDIYLPYRPKRRTRALMARERGLEPLAEMLFAQKDGVNPTQEAAAFVRLPSEGAEGDKDGVPDAAAALAGARDILAERFAEDATARHRMRGLFTHDALLISKLVNGKDEEGAKFRDYFAWEELASKAPSHRILAMYRAETEGIVRLSLRPRQEEDALALLARLFVRSKNACGQEVLAAVEDSYRRLLAPALETEARNALKTRADIEAIRVFADNARELLLAPPLGEKAVMGVDPGFRTGCKAVCLSPQGALLAHITVNPHAGSASAAQDAARILLDMAIKYNVEAVAVGNGTAGRETEAFMRDITGWPAHVPVIMVNESGASIYSASEVARAEFPDLDLTYRGAVSIGRRLMDPLAELVKIDPKAIGVGQYQHDVHQGDLKKSLDDVVMSCVNGVGVEVNTASEQLLTYVSGLGPSLARNVVAWRTEHGPFASRKELLKVPRLGPRAFEQAAGFLRIRGGKNPLDASAVHPESYTLVERMAADCRLNVAGLLSSPEARRALDLKQYVTDSVGLPTLTDIVAELEKPGRDPRPAFTVFSFAPNVSAPSDLVPGMRLPGIVTNVTAFGAFVDVGVHQDGLVHVSHLANRFVKNPSEVVRVRQEVLVTVLDVDLKRGRIALSMKE